MSVSVARSAIQKFFLDECERKGFSSLIQCDELLSRHTYYRIGGPALIFAHPRSEEEILFLLSLARTAELPVFVLGSGSNLLVSDSGFYGLVLRSTGRVYTHTVYDEKKSIVTVGSGVAVSSLLRWAVRQGCGGFELLAGVPGSMGGVVTMNAGTHLGEAGSRITRVQAWINREQSPTSPTVPTGLPLGESATDLGSDWEKRDYSGKDLRFEYRRNLFLPPICWITEVDWKVEAQDPLQLQTALDALLVRRKASQPVDFPSCGSVFKNPMGGEKAWQVIDRLGLRGWRMGQAQISEKHPNFIVNLGGARAADVRALIEKVQIEAKTRCGLEMEPEVRFLGDFGTPDLS